MSAERFYHGLYLVFCYTPLVGWALILWFNLAERTAVWRAKVTWKKTGVVFLSLVLLMALRWDHDMMFYRTYWFEFIRLFVVLALTGAFYTRLVSIVTRPGRPKWQNVLITVIFFIVVFLPLFNILFVGTTPCA